jgi:Tfp pilus assembly protein PilF/TolB-like protein
MMRLMAVALAVSMATGTGNAAGEQASTSATMVMPFANPDNTPKLYWLGEGSAVLLGEFLERYGARTMTRDERVRAFERLQLPPAAALSHATMIKAGQFVGATDVVIGSYELANDRLTLRVRVIQLEAARMGAEVVERGALTDLFEMFDRAARRMVGAVSPAPAPAAGTLLASPAAFELYIKGLIAESSATQRSFLEQAGKAAPADDRIRLALWQVHSERGDYAQALAVANRVPANSLHSRTARYLAARSQLELKRYDDAFNTLKALQGEGRSAAVLNALGIVQLRRGATTTASGRAVYYFNQASQTDPSDADYFFNLGYGYWIDKDPPAAVYWMREAVRRDPTDGEAHLVLAAALQQGGAAAEAARERELAQRLAAPAGTAADPVPRGLERMKADLNRTTSRVDALITATGQRDQNEVAIFHLDNGRRAFEREADREAEQELRRALYLSPYLAEAHLLLGRVYLRGGRIGDAIQAFKVALWSEDSARGHVALAEAHIAAQDLAAARQELDRALQLDPSSDEARSLRAKIAP